MYVITNFPGIFLLLSEANWIETVSQKLLQSTRLIGLIKCITINSSKIPIVCISNNCSRQSTTHVHYNRFVELDRYFLESRRVDWCFPRAFSFLSLSQIDKTRSIPSNLSVTHSHFCVRSPSPFSTLSFALKIPLLSRNPLQIHPCSLPLSLFRWFPNQLEELRWIGASEQTPTINVPPGQHKKTLRPCPPSVRISTRPGQVPKIKVSSVGSRLFVRSVGPVRFGCVCVCPHGARGEEPPGQLASREGTGLSEEFRIKRERWKVGPLGLGLWNRKVLRILGNLPGYWWPKWRRGRHEKGNSFRKVRARISWKQRRKDDSRAVNW